MYVGGGIGKSNIKDEIMNATFIPVHVLKYPKEKK
jgi:hypothetical protein